MIQFDLPFLLNFVYMIIIVMRAYWESPATLLLIFYGQVHALQHFYIFYIWFVHLVS